MAMQTIATSTKFRLALPVSDLPRSLRFYRILLKSEPGQSSPTSARFETDNPPLELTLLAGEKKSPGGTLNHLGFRMPEQVQLVDLQRRLEEAGVSTQRQDGVECCYARQTKFWVTDPDKHLWELYIFHEDIDHSGFDDHANTQPWKAKGEPKSWTHPVTEAIPERLDFADASLDEVNLAGTFNAKMDAAVKTRLLSEILRVLKPGGEVSVHGMCGDRPFPGEPAFPGMAAVVKHVPDYRAMIADLSAAGFVNCTLEKFDGICLSHPGVELREIRLHAAKPAHRGKGAVLYRGPFEEIVADNGVTFRRGERVAVDATTLAALRQGAAADQFVFFA